MKGYKNHLITGMIPLTTNKFESVSLYDIGEWLKGSRAPEYKQLANAVKNLRNKVDIFHVHNEPDWIVRVVGENKGRAKMVFDVHDLASKRSCKEEPEERRAIELSDGLITVSGPYLKHIVDKYNYKKPNTYVYSCVPHMLFNKVEYPRIPGIVYEGGLNPVISTNQFLKYRNFAGFLKHCNEKKIDFHLFPADPGFDYSYYRNNGAYLYPSKNFIELVNELSRFDAGFVGTPIPDPEFEGAMPNKLFELAAAGVPSLCFNAKVAGKFIEKNGLGVNVTKLEDLPKCLEMAKKMRPQVRKNRWKWTMERQIKKTERIYEEVL